MNNIYQIISILSFVLVGVSGLGYFKTLKSKQPSEVISLYKDMNDAQNKKIQELEDVINQNHEELMKLQEKVKDLENINKETWSKINEKPYAELRDYMVTRFDALDKRLEGLNKDKQVINITK